MECLLVDVKREGQLVDIHSRGDIGIDHHNAPAVSTRYLGLRLKVAWANFDPIVGFELYRGQWSRLEYSWWMFDEERR